MNILTSEDRLFLSKLALAFAMAITQKQYLGLANLVNEYDMEVKKEKDEHKGKDRL